MRVLVAGWIGSTNVGDELVFTGVRRLLGPQARVCAVSVDPAATVREHGVAAIDHRRIDRVGRATRSADLVVIGGGGIIQDRTSALNLPYHLSRAWLARLGRTPWVGLALGVGPLTTPAGRALARTLKGAAAVTVRDEGSADLLATLGVPCALAADAAVHAAEPGPREAPRAGPEVPEGTPSAEAGDAIVVSLRPWSADARRLPVGWGRGPGEPSWFVQEVADALGSASRRSGLPVRFVALQTDRDQRLHQRVAAAMDAPTELVVPTRHTVLAELARGRVVVAMRYHAALGAVLAGRPGVLIGYTPKVDALAHLLGTGGSHLAFERAALRDLDEAVAAQLETPDLAAVARTAELLHARGRANREVLAPWLT